MLDKLPVDLTLVGKHVKLEPLQLSHRAELLAAAQDGELWNLAVTHVPNEEQIDQYLELATENRLLRIHQPFVVRRLLDGKAVGTTRYYDIEPQHRNVAIGHTWYSKSAQRSAINTECKLLLLRHAFEEMNCIAVNFHTHHQNIASQNAIQRLGAQKDGMLRNDKILADGSIRHTMVYSITHTEWPITKDKLSNSLAAHES